MRKWTDCLRPQKLLFEVRLLDYHKNCGKIKKYLEIQDMEP